MCAIIPFQDMCALLCENSFNLKKIIADLLTKSVIIIDFIHMIVCLISGNHWERGLEIWKICQDREISHRIMFIPERRPIRYSLVFFSSS